MVSHLIISFHEGLLLSIIQGDLDIDKLIFYSAICAHNMWCIRNDKTGCFLWKGI